MSDATERAAIDFVVAQLTDIIKTSPNANHRVAVRFALSTIKDFYSLRNAVKLLVAAGDME